jgi:hypothetical protein
MYLAQHQDDAVSFFLPFALCFFISLALLVFPFFSVVKLFFTFHSASQVLIFFRIYYIDMEPG